MALNPMTGELEDPAAAKRVRRAVAFDVFLKIKAHLEKNSNEAVVVQFKSDRLAVCLEKKVEVFKWFGLKSETELRQTTQKGWMPYEKNENEGFSSVPRGTIWHSWMFEEIKHIYPFDAKNTIRFQDVASLLPVIKAVCPKEYVSLERGMLSARFARVVEKTESPHQAL